MTHDYHQTRALAAFARAATEQRWPITFTPAPMGVLHPPENNQVVDFLPSPDGLQATVESLHEWLGRLAGA